MGRAAGFGAMLGLAGLIVFGFLAPSLRSDPTVAQVAELALGSMPVPADQALRQTVDGVGFPDWNRWGWKALGGRVDTMAAGRQAKTVLYARGEDRVAYTVVEGKGDVNAVGGQERYRFPRGPRGPKVPLTVTSSTVNDFQLVQIKRHRDERNVILTAWPSNDRMLDVVQLQALRPPA